MTKQRFFADMETLPLLFFFVAMLYSTVGFGGGSSYLALLVLFEFPYEMVPPLALICNLVVVTGGSFLFVRAGHCSWTLTLPFILTSIPFAYLGGSIHVEEDLFLFILGVCLLVSGLRMLRVQRKKLRTTLDTSPLQLWSCGPCVGAVLGFVSGLVGIGGGIFLAPILHNINWGKPKQIAATSSVFILVNSLAGLIGQWIKHPGLAQWSNGYFLLFLAVLAGGQLGSRMGVHKLSQRSVMRLTAVLVLLVAGRILLKGWLLSKGT